MEAPVLDAFSDADCEPNAAMILAIPLLARLLLLPLSGTADNNSGEEPAAYAASVPRLAMAASAQIHPSVLDSIRTERANQVRIEEHITIRIVPRGARLDPDMQPSMPDRPFGLRLSERRIGRCLPVAGIAGVRPNQGGELILYMRDRRVVSGMLERACRARDFYSGFYLARGDGKLCVDRDVLQSRSGANCRLAQIREVVLDD
jgi:hypothetical protein